MTADPRGAARAPRRDGARARRRHACRDETEAAVLVPLYVRDDELHAVFTKRREDLRRHPGEISFPGGRRDHPTRSSQTTALREAEEEIGLSPGDGRPDRHARAGQHVRDRLRDLSPRRADRARSPWKPSPNEVELVLELPLHALVERLREAADHAPRLHVRRPTPTSSATTSSGAPPRASSATCWHGWAARRAAPRVSLRRPSRSARRRGCPTRSTSRRSC